MVNADAARDFFPSHTILIGLVYKCRSPAQKLDPQRLKVGKAFCSLGKTGR